MKVRIVCYENVHQWIIGKFALKMQANLELLGHEVSIDNVIDESADINHHLIYRGYSFENTGIQTLMVTHVDSTKKMHLLKKQLEVAQMGICMSRETMDYLVNLGLPREKLSYVNPAHDGVIKPRKLRVGLTCRVQSDGRKREHFLGRLVEYINPEDFSFTIMGDGWEEQIALLRNAGFEVEWHESFDYEKYIVLIPTLDYYLYMGQDEGQMGFIDAVAAGVKTIVTNQGYHLDANNGITHGFSSFEELAKIFKQIASEREDFVRSVASWNWQDYTLKHIDIWNYLLSKKRNEKFNAEHKDYLDGINSVHDFDTIQIKRDYFKASKDFLDLVLGKLKHSYYGKKNKRKKLKSNVG